MFRIKKLTLINNNDEYTYNFSESINYFRGKNDTGKTEFYKFIDYMFASSTDISGKEWFKNHLTRAKLIFEFNNINYELTRSLDGKHNLFKYCDEKQDEYEDLDIEEYKHKINSVFSKSSNYDNVLFAVTNEHLTFRSFTLFNYLDEIHQGLIHDFFTKCSELKYSIHLNSILNFLFNNNIEKIIELSNKLEKKQSELRSLDNERSTSLHLFERINKNLRILNIQERFNGSNKEKILELLEKSREFENDEPEKSKPTSKLLPILNSIEEQIKIYRKIKSDAKSIEKESERRKLLLNTLQDLIENNDNYKYLTEPIIALISQLDKSISFQRLLIEDRTIEELKNKHQELKLEIESNDERLKKYSVSEKDRAYILVESDLENYKLSNDSQINELKKEISELKKKIRDLQNQDDNKRIQEISEYVNELYTQCSSVSNFVKDDLQRNKFEIRYYKKGNILSPTIIEEDGEKTARVSYDIGSLARQTLIQLCGYLSFLKFIIKDDRIPIIPMLVIDHISKPFDKDNLKSLGTVLQKFINDVGESNVQIIMFEDKNAEELNLSPNYSEELQKENKSGFNPFYFKINKIDNEEK